MSHTPMQTLYLNFNVQWNQKQTGILSQTDDLGTGIQRSTKTEGN